MSLSVIRPGLLSSVQDLGRYGYQKHGVIVSGAMDPLAHRLANILVGNQENAATLELTMIGPVLDFTTDMLISLCGGDLSPAIDGVLVPMSRPVWVTRGSRLTFGKCAAGCRTYLAAAGGFSIPSVMGSRSTYLRGGIGGYQGRALKAGDVLELGAYSEQSNRLISQLSARCEDRRFIATAWAASSQLTPMYQENQVVRVIRGSEFEWFTEESRQQFFKQDFIVTPQSDRMGYRLKGPPLSLTDSRELISESVGFGTIQVPKEGQPIVLLADRQTTGGYPKIAQVISIDLPIMAQAKPGDRIQFREVSHRQAEKWYLERENELRQLKRGISLQA